MGKLEENVTSKNKNEHLIRHFLEKKKRPYQCIGRGLNNDVCYIGTYIEDDNGITHNAVVTSDRRIYIDYGSGKNQIKNDFDLKYRDDFFYNVLDSWWENESIRKWLFENYIVDIRTLYNKIVEINRKFMIYEDEKCHIYTAVDIIRTYFFHLFNSNSRTHHHADPGSGKTNQMMIYRALSFNPIASPDFSSSSIYRIIESTGGTILIDDFDDLDPDTKARLNRHIKVNYKPFKALRADGGKRFTPQGYDAYSHVVFNNTGGVYDNITSERVVTLRLLKHQDARDAEVDYKNSMFKNIRNDLYCCLLQYWKEVKKAYDGLKVEELSARDLELFKGPLAIAKIIGEDVYKEILDFAVNYLQQTSLKDLEDDWEYNLLEELYYRVKDLKENQTIDVFVKELTNTLSVKLFDEDMSKAELKKKLYQLRSFIGGKLTGYILFKKKIPQNRACYEVHLTGVRRVLKSRFGLDGLDELNERNQKEKKLQEGAKKIIDLLRGKPRLWHIHGVANRCGLKDDDVNELIEQPNMKIIRKTEDGLIYIQQEGIDNLLKEHLTNLT